MHTSSRPIGILMAGRLSVSQILKGRSRYYLVGQGANQVTMRLAAVAGEERESRPSVFVGTNEVVLGTLVNRGKK
jgi:hypothetical protein